MCSCQRVERARGGGRHLLPYLMIDVTDSFILCVQETVNVAFAMCPCGDTKLNALPQALKVQPVSDFGNPSEIARRFGGPQAMREAVAALTEALYAA